MVRNPRSNGPNEHPRRRKLITPKSYTTGFLGTVQHTVDPRGRVAFPTRQMQWQNAMLPSETALAPFLRKGVIFLIPPGLLKKQPSHTLQAYSYVHLDGQRRVVIPESLRTASGIIDSGTNIMITGNGPYVALYAPGTPANDPHVLLSAKELAGLLEPSVFEKLPKKQELATEPTISLQQRVLAIIEEALGTNGDPLDVEIAGIRIRANITVMVDLHVEPVVSPLRETRPPRRSR